MICAACAETTGDAPCTECGADPLLDGRFRLDEVIGRGARSVTYRATVLDDGPPRTVAVKETPLPPGSKAAALAEREAAVLRQLDHPQIPAFVASVVAGSGKARSLYLVQEHVPGVDLRTRLATHRYTEAEVLDTMASLCPVLAYLHGLSPPVVHRDLKPANVIRRDDGTHALVDFGAVRDAVRDDGGSTVAGTFGYMAPEQFAGDAEPRSDLYALGALAVALLTRQDPASLAGRDRRIRWRGRTRVSPETAALIDALLAIEPEDRPPSAEAVAERIRCLRATAEPVTQPMSELAGCAEIDDAGADTVVLPVAAPVPRAALALIATGGMLSGGAIAVGAGVLGVVALILAPIGPMPLPPVPPPLGWSLALPAGLPPAPVDTLVEEARFALQVGDSRQALENLYRVLEVDPAYPDARPLAAAAGEQVLVDGLEVLIAERAAARARAQAAAPPPTGTFLPLEAFAALEEGRYDRATTLCLDRLARPSPPEERAEALRVLRTAQAATARETRARWTLAMQALADGRIPEAAHLLALLEASHPAHPSARAHLERIGWPRQ